MTEEEVVPVTLDEQFKLFAKEQLFPEEEKRDGTTINLYRSDYWMRQAKLLDDRTITTTDTGIAFLKWGKSELNFEEFKEFLADLGERREVDITYIEEYLTTCGTPGESPVDMPQYRDFFLTYKPYKNLFK